MKPFQTMDEVDAYLGGDRIECLVCGKRYRRLQFKHLALHDMTADDYRAMFGVPWNRSLTSEPSRQATARTITAEQIELLRHGKPNRNMQRRPLAPAVMGQWKKNAELGRTIAREMVVTGCGKCGAPVETTALCATQPIYCERCASAWSLRMRAHYRRERDKDERQIA